MCFFVNGFTDDSDNLISIYRTQLYLYSLLLFEHLNFLQSNLYHQHSEWK